MPPYSDKASHMNIIEQWNAFLACQGKQRLQCLRIVYEDQATQVWRTFKEHQGETLRPVPELPGCHPHHTHHVPRVPCCSGGVLETRSVYLVTKDRFCVHSCRDYDTTAISPHRALVQALLQRWNTLPRVSLQRVLIIAENPITIGACRGYSNAESLLTMHADRDFKSLGHLSSCKLTDITMISPKKLFAIYSIYSRNSIWTVWKTVQHISIAKWSNHWKHLKEGRQGMQRQSQKHKDGNVTTENVREDMETMTC